MLSETIRSRLAERFAAPLPEFHKRRIIFWHDEDGEFAEAVDELALSGVRLVKLTGKNNFAVKKLLAADDLISNVYTISQGKSGMIGVYRLETQMLPGNGKFERTEFGCVKR